MNHRQTIPFLRLALLTAAAIAIHGYHFGADDGAVYLPAVVRSIHPNLYPFGAEFFESHAKLSQFTALVVSTARLAHLSVEWTIFLWHILSLFIFFLAAWRLANICFTAARASWSAVMLLATGLTAPVAGSGILLMDPYLTARSISTPLTLLAIAAFLSGRRREALLWLVLTALVHPQMAIFAAACLAILSLPERWTAPLFELHPWAGAAAAVFPLGFTLAPSTPKYRQAIDMRSFLSVVHWTWYEWMGVAAPLVFFLCLSRFPPRATTPAFNRIDRALILFGSAATTIAIVLASTPRLETFLRLQPMRAFQLIYIVFFVLLGGLLGEYVLKSRYWLWGALFAALGVGIFLIQRNVYAGSRHIEWPGAAPENPWVAAFEWARDNTPPDAVFALDPWYIELPGEDQHGFRGIAQRSVLTDHFKDSGVVSLFPQLAPEWAREQRAQQDWTHFQLTDFEHLARIYPVSWVVLQGPPTKGLNCPYKNEAVEVCQIPGATSLNMPISTFRWMPHPAPAN
jgi:hypothetical protein